MATDVVIMKVCDVLQRLTRLLDCHRRAGDCVEQRAHAMADELASQRHRSGWSTSKLCGNALSDHIVFASVVRIA